MAQAQKVTSGVAVVAQAPPNGDLPLTQYTAQSVVLRGVQNQQYVYFAFGDPSHPINNSATGDFVARQTQNKVSPTEAKSDGSTLTIVGKATWNSRGGEDCDFEFSIGKVSAGQPASYTLWITEADSGTVLEDISGQTTAFTLTNFP